MANRNFNEWLSTMKDSIATWTYYTDFKKVYENVQKIKIELNILNTLIGSKNIEEEFRKIVEQYPNVLRAVPILLAKREGKIKIQDTDSSYVFDFENLNFSLEHYVLFMRNSGLFDLLQNHIINNLVDYVLGVEVGMDTNGRKSRTGDVMENLIEAHLVKSGLVKDKTYFKEMKASEVASKFNLDLTPLTNNGKAEKRFDFVFIGAYGKIYVCECNFYATQGSKLSETARSYKTLALESQEIKGLEFVWFTDGIGWISARKNLEETFDIMPYLFNLNDLEQGVLNKLIEPSSYLEELVY